MTTITLSTSPLAGRSVRYVDAIRLLHTGVIVGQSRDGAWQYVRSDNPRADQAAEWHFKLRTPLAQKLSAPTAP
jgi:hypothetical protein